MKLSADQLILIGIIASVATQLLKLAADKLGYKPNKIVVNSALLVVAIVLAMYWGDFNFPASEDPMALALALLQEALAVFGFASLIYNALLKDVVYPAIKLG